MNGNTGYSELSHEQKPAEVDGTNPSHEMGYDEVGGTERKPYEMEARETGR